MNVYGTSVAADYTFLIILIGGLERNFSALRNKNRNKNKKS